MKMTVTHHMKKYKIKWCNSSDCIEFVISAVYYIYVSRCNRSLNCDLGEHEIECFHRGRCRDPCLVLREIQQRSNYGR